MWIIVVAVGVMAWRAWSRHTAQAAEKTNSGATGDHRWEALRNQNGGTGTTANAAEHDAHTASIDNAHADTQTSN
jgi:hypothetical protein